jgi:hypothetical protein
LFRGDHDICGPVKNSRVRKSGRELDSPLINSILKSKIERIACHLANIYLEAIFFTSFSRTSLADLQSIRKLNSWFNKSS